MGTKTMDDMVDEVGPFGRFQYLLLFLSMTCVPMATWSMLFMVFGAVEPDWWCESYGPHNTSEPLFLNNSFGDPMSTALPAAVTDLTTSSGAQKQEYNLTNDDDLQTDNSSYKYCGTLDGPHGVCKKIVFAPGMSTVVSQFQLVCELSWVPTMMISIQMVGVLVGAFVAGIMSDGIGRKKTSVTIMTLHAVFNLIAAFSGSWQMYAVMRALIGTTTGGTFATAFGYPTEFVGIRWRAVVCSLPLWGVGALVFSLLVWALPDWMYLQIISAVVTAICVPGWMFSCSLSYYGISFGVKDLSGNFFMNFFLISAFEVWPSLLVYPLANFLGRRWSAFGSLFLTMLSTLAAVPISLLLPFEEGGNYVNALCIVARTGLNIGWSIVFAFLTESFPTAVRSIGMGFANTVARLGGILAPYILAFGEPYMFYAIISGIMAVSCIAPLLMTETRGRPLEEKLPPMFDCFERNSCCARKNRKQLELVVMEK